MFLIVEFENTINKYTKNLIKILKTRITCGQGCKFAFVFKCECDGFAKCECECDENAKALRILNANAKRMRRIFSHSHFRIFAF